MVHKNMKHQVTNKWHSCSHWFINTCNLDSDWRYERNSFPKSQISRFLSKKRISKINQFQYNILRKLLHYVTMRYKTYISEFLFLLGLEVTRWLVSNQQLTPSSIFYRLVRKQKKYYKASIIFRFWVTYSFLILK